MHDFGDIAQVAITLAGFAGLVGVLHGRRKEGLPQVAWMHIANLLMASTFVVILAFVPQWLAQYPDSDGAVWLWSVRVLLVMHLLAFAIVLPFGLKGRALWTTFPRLDRYMVYVTGSLGVGLVVAETSVSFGLAQSYAPFLFQGALLFFVSMAMANFVILLLRYR